MGKWRKIRRRRGCRPDSMSRRLSYDNSYNTFFRVMHIARSDDDIVSLSIEDPP